MSRLSKFLFIAAIFLVIPLSISAQSLSIQPSTQTIGVGGSNVFNIIVNSPGVNSGVAVRLTIDSAIGNFIATTLNPSFTITAGCADASANFDADELCFDAAQGVAFTEGQTIATVTLYGVAEGSVPLTFAAGTEFSDGGSTTPFTGTAGTWTVSSTVLPEAGLVEDILESPFLLAAALLITFGFLLNRIPGLSFYSYLFMSEEQRGRIDKEILEMTHKKESDKITSEREEFESKFQE